MWVFLQFYLVVLLFCVLDLDGESFLGDVIFNDQNSISVREKGKEFLFLRILQGCLAGFSQRWKIPQLGRFQR